MFLSLFSYGITVVANASLGLAILLRKREQKENQLFALLAFSIVFWIGFGLLYYLVDAQPWVLWIARATLAFATLIPLAIFQFVEIFPQQNVVVPKLLRNSLYFSTFLFFILSFTPLIDAAEYARGSYRLTTYGPLYSVFLLEIIYVCCVSFWVLFVKFRKARGIFRIQLFYLFLGLFSMFFAAIIFNGILPYIIDFTGFQALGSLSSIGFIGFTTYAIVKHRFMDINRVIGSILKQIVILIFLGIIYSGAVYMVSILFFPRLLDIRYVITAVGVCLGIRLIIQPFVNNTQILSDLPFFRKLYSKERVFNEIQEITSSEVRLKDLIFYVLNVLQRNLQATSIRYISVSEKGARLTSNTPQKRIIPLENKKSIEFLSQVNDIVVTDLLLESPFKKYLQKEKIDMIFPLQITKRNVRLLIFGPKKNKEPYFPYDFKTLKNISQMLIIAIQNARYIQSIQQFNESLSHEVEKATKELLRANTQLRQADKRKDEFISIASHELKTPTTAIQGFLWLVLQKDKELSSYSREKLEKVAKLTEQLTTLVNDMLDVSKIESKKITLHPEVFDIGQLVEEIKGEMDLFAIKKNIKIQVKNGKAFQVFADRQRARQIISNLINNAIKYTPEGGKVGVTFQTNDTKVEVAVKDTGIGIREEDRHKLFTKFGKLDDGNSISSHLPGTGLGLYIAKNFVELSGGEIDVESTYGKGSVFTFSLPTK